MNPFRYELSLRARHPTRIAADIESALTLKAWVTNTVSEARRTPKGNPLEGINRETRCSFELSKGDDQSLLEEIAEWNLRFLDKKAFFEEFAASGGKMEYFLGLFLDGNSGFDLPPEEMGKMRELGITLSLDIYP